MLAKIYKYVPEKMNLRLNRKKTFVTEDLTLTKVISLVPAIRCASTRDGYSTVMRYTKQSRYFGLNFSQFSHQ